MKFLAILILVTLMRASIACNDCEFSMYGISTGPFPCTITGEKVYLRGLYYKDITDKEMLQLVEYKKQMSEYDKKIDSYYKQPWYKMTNMTLPQLPRRPSFCGDNTTVIYRIGECKVLGTEVFIKNVPVRTISTAEQQQLNNFYKQVQTYVKYLKQQMNQGFNPFMPNPSNNMKSSVAPPPPDPVAPDVCYTI